VLRGQPRSIAREISIRNPKKCPDVLNNHRIFTFNLCLIYERLMVMRASSRDR
jgi:hypothetical protein